MNEENLSRKTGEGEKFIVSQNLSLLRDFNKALTDFIVLTKASHGNPLNNSDDLDNIARIHDLALDVANNHLDIMGAMLDAAVQRNEVAYLKEKLIQSECLVRYAIEYQKDIKVSIANDLAYGYHEKYGN